MSEEKTLYKQLVEKWQNNKIIAYSVISIGVLATCIATYQQFSEFAANLTDKTENLFEFNKSVRPIYFVERRLELAQGQEAHIVEIANKIIELQPDAVLLHSHTSRIGARTNVRLTQMRGEFAADVLIRELRCDYDGEVIVVARGGADTKGQDAGYEQRVDIELSGNASGVVGVQIPINDDQTIYLRACE